MDTLHFILFLASRNVLRYWKRSLQVFAIIFSGAACIILMDAFLRGFSDSTESRIIAQFGHMDAHAPGYLESAEAYPLDLALESLDETRRVMLDAAKCAVSPGTIALSAASISSAGMLSDGEISSPGGIFASEAFALGASGSRTIPNPALKTSKERILDGRFFSTPEDSGAIIDEKLSRKLKLSPGKSLILLCTDAFGSFGMAEIPVIGIAAEGSLPEGALCLTDLGSLQKALGLEDKASVLSLWYLKERDSGYRLLGKKAEKNATLAAASALGARGLQTRPFSLIAKEYAAMFDFLSYFLLGMILVFALVAGAGMANAILLSVQDRSKDLGTLRAIALSSKSTAILVGMETFIIALLAALSAMLLCSLTLALMERTGVKLAFELSAGKETVFPKIIRPVFLPSRVGIIACICAIFPLIATIFPMRVASRLTIHEALTA